jgi:phospholipid/cholesterol/gamma-HCH transport system permease protein
MADELTAPAPAAEEPKPTRPDPFTILLIFIGELALLLGRTVREIYRGGVSVPDLIEQMSSLGVSSISIALLTNFTSGGVLSLYFTPFLNQYGATQFVGGVVALAVARELAPVLTGVVFTARSGSMIAAEIGTMKVTEQVDALRALAVSPIRYLVVPRLLACLVMFPTVCALADAAGIFGGYVVAVYMKGTPPHVFTDSIKNTLLPSDFTLGMVKTVFFAIVVALVGCQQGLATRGGATEVGKATTNTVVISIVLVYILNFILADVLFPQ